jgi:arylsulfatase A-like enzyme
LNTVDTIDEMIGAILDAVEGLDDILFVLSSDHGGTADGEHGRPEDEHVLIPIFYKGCIFVS